MPALSIGGYGPTRQEAMDKIEEAAEVTIEGLRETGQPVPQSLLDGGFRGANAFFDILGFRPRLREDRLSQRVDGEC